MNKESVSPACKDTGVGTGKSHSFPIARDKYRRGRWYGNGNHKASGSRLEQLEECNGVLSISVWDRITCCNEVIIQTDWGKRDEGAMVDCMYGVTRKYKFRNEHIRGIMGVAIEMVRPCDDGRWRTHSGESFALLGDFEFQGEGYNILTYRYDRSIIILCVTQYFHDAETNHPTCIAQYN